MSVELMPERTSVQALAAINKIEIDTQIATAKAYPRDVARIQRSVMDIIESDQEIAEACFYTLPRGDNVKGPSVRLAELYVTNWQNLRVQTRVVEDTGTMIRCEAVVFDVENNTSYRGEATRRLTKANGQRYSDDMVVTTANACSAIAYRNAVFKIIPGVLVSRAYALALEKAVGDISQIKERAGKSIAAFGKLGVTREMILNYTGKASTEDFTLETLEELLGIYNAIKEKSTTIDAVFKPKDTAKPKGKTIEEARAATMSTPPPEFDEPEQAELPQGREPGEEG